MLGRRRVAREAPTAFRSIRVFDGERFLDVQDVVVIADRIVACGDQGTVEVPGDALTIRGAGRTLLPGFIDAHVHLGFFKPRRVLRAGVTTVRDLGRPPEQLAPLPPAGPRVLLAGQMLTAAGGYPSRAAWAPPGTAREVGSPDDARAAVREQLARGATTIKVVLEPRQGPVPPADVLRAIVAEAAGRTVTAHLGALALLEPALEAGVTELAHGLWSDERIPDAAIERMLDAGITVVPTLHIDPSASRLDNLARFVAGGGRVVYGTDMGNTPVPGGIDPDELRLMTEAGMTLDRALAAATSVAAAHLGLPKRGRVRTGWTADLVMVRDDPRGDLGVLASPLLVMQDGRAVR